MAKGYTNDFHQVSRQEIEVIGRAMCGDIAFKMNPATSNALIAAQNAADYERFVEILLVDTNGRVHEWFNGDITISVGEVTAGDGAIAIVGGDTTPKMVKGRCIVELSYSGTFAKGVAQVETATVVGTITKAGNASVIVTAAGMTGTPKTIAVAVALDDTATLVAGKIRVALAADAAVAALFNVSGEGAEVILTKKVTGANDTTLNIATDNGTCEGLTTAASSANTTAGVAKDTNTLTVAQQTILGATVTAKTSVETSI